MEEQNYSRKRGMVLELAPLDIKEKTPPESVLITTLKLFKS